MCPGNANGVVAIKPTVGLTSRAGVVPISHTQDTVGPHGRTVADAAVALSVIQSRTPDARDAATAGAPLAGRTLAGRTLADAIAFNEAQAAKEMPFFAQEIFESSNSPAPGADDPQPGFDGMTYNQALEIDRLSGVNGIDRALRDFNLDAVIAPADNPAWSTDVIYADRFLFGSSGLAAGAGYPIVQVPAAMVLGLPLGISFFGTAFSEPTLIRLASGFEAATRVRAQNPPTFAPTLPDDHVESTIVHKPRASSKQQRKVPAPGAAPWRPRHM